MIIVDNSEYTRNGDFSPSRFQSQLDAVSILSRNKTGANAESSVGLVDTAGPTCHMSLVTDADLEKLLASLHRIPIKGKTNLSAAVNVAMLALKHRINKRQEQRVIAFVASPVQETEAELKTLGVRMKKNKVAIDVVSFGEDGQNAEKLQAFVSAANSGDNSHYLSIATKPYVILTDELAGSPIFGASMVMAGGAGDDDLEMAIRLSLQDQGAAVPAPGGGAAPAAAAAANPNAMAVDDDLAQAIALSMGGMAPGAAGDIDEDMELAIRLSMQDSMDTDAPAEAAAPATTTTSSTSPQQETPAKPAEEPEADVDSEFIQSLVSNLDGVDPNDPHFQELVAALKKEAKDDKDNKDKKPEDK